MKAVQAAGIVTSYFGMISENRPVRFPVHIGAIPPGNAILIAEDPSSLPAVLNLSGVTSPTVAMRDNPNDLFSKLLIITGGSADDLIKAAQAVALHSEMLDGPQAAIEGVTLPGKQAPDGAPRWARTDQTIALWDYASAEQMQGDGTAPLNVYFRIPPDIYYATEGPNTKLHVVYRYNSVPIGPISSMQVRVNDAFMGSIPLIPGQETSRRMQTDIAVPVVNLRPFSNSLSFDFTFQLLKKQGCEDTTPINMQGAILRDSFLDLRDYPHWAPMPNLELFSNAGFPFTRVADLSETTVVLPPTPTEQEIETFVTLMGHFSRQTGFPALRVTVAGPDALHEGANSDFLIIGSGNDQPGFDKLGTHLPVSLGSGQVQVRDTQGFFVNLLHHAWWKLENDDHTESGYNDHRRHSRRHHRRHRISVRHRQQSQHCCHSSQGRHHLPALHGYLHAGAAVRRHLWFRRGFPRIAISIFPRRRRGLSCGCAAVVDTIDVVVHAGAMAGGSDRNYSRFPARYLDPAMVARQG